MGLQMTSLKRLPLTNEVDFYIFQISLHERIDGFTEEFNRYFRNLALGIGEENILVEPLNEFWGSEIPKRYLGKDAKELIRNNLYPGLLITDKHPNDIKENDDTLKLYIPLNRIFQEYGSYTSLIEAIVVFVKSKGKDKEFLHRFINVNESFLEKLNSIIDLRPNLFGFGFNINKFLEKIL